MLVDIVVISYKDSKRLARCVDGIHTNCKDYNLILVDNNLVNRGYSAGCNYGASLGQAPYIMLLNSDAYIQPGCLEALIDRAQPAEVGMVGAKQVDPQDPGRITFGGALGSPYPYGRHMGGRVEYGNCSVPERQIWLNGAAVLIKRKLWLYLRGMDERFFLFYSDSDFSLRAKQAGAELWYEPEAVVYHKLGASSSGGEHMEKDKLTFEKKWDIPTQDYKLFNLV